jgi:hypothetical protein
MPDERADSERSLAQERLTYWRQVYEAAVATNDKSTVEQARRIIEEYEALLAQLDDPKNSGSST